MSEFKKIETQEQLDAIIQERLRRNTETIENKYKDYETLKSTVSGFEDIKNGYESRINDLNDKITGFESSIAEKDSKIRTLELDAIKVKVAREEGIPFEAYSRLRGEDETQIRQDASALAPLFAKQKGAVKRSPEAGQTSDDPYKELLKSLKKEEE